MSSTIYADENCKIVFMKFSVDAFENGMLLCLVLLDFG